MASTPLNERQNQLVQNLVRSGQALLGIINDILDLSKIEAGRFDLVPVEFDPRELVAEVTDLFCERCTSKGLEFVYFVGEDVPRRLTGDSARLRQVLINLVGNAMKFTENGEILIEVSLARQSEDQVTVLFSVKDTGIGIEAPQQQRIFESFHQVDSSMTRARGGSGLGLSIVKELVQLMGGDVGVESEVGSRLPVLVHRAAWPLGRARRRRQAGDRAAAARPGGRQQRRQRPHHGALFRELADRRGDPRHLRRGRGGLARGRHGAAPVRRGDRRRQGSRLRGHQARAQAAGGRRQPGGRSHPVDRPRRLDRRCQPGKRRRLRAADQAAAPVGAVRLPGADRLRGARERRRLLLCTQIRQAGAHRPSRAACWSSRTTR